MNMFLFLRPVWSSSACNRSQACVGPEEDRSWRDASTTVGMASGTRSGRIQTLRAGKYQGFAAKEALYSARKMQTVGLNTYVREEIRL